MLSWIILPFVTGVRINGFVAGARNFMGFRNNDERIVCYRTNGGGGIEGEVEERDSSRLVKSSPPHCLQYLLEACVYIYIYTLLLLLLLLFRQGSSRIEHLNSHSNLLPSSSYPPSCYTPIANPIFPPSPRARYLF